MLKNMINKKSLTIIALSVIFLSACSNDAMKNQENISLDQKTPVTNDDSSPQLSIQEDKVTTTPASKSASEKTDFVSIKTKDGEIILKLYQEEAPNTVANFTKKADSGFYKNLIFHRVEPGFVVQGGDPKGNGTGGGNIKSEINSIPFKRGSLGLARGTDIEISNDSQFFICLTTEACSQLTNGYVNFGEVVSGLDVLDKIEKGDSILDIITKTK